MTAQPASTSSYTVEDYLRLDAEAEEVRYEYVDGHIYALAGASPEHNLIKENISGEIYGGLRPEGCRSFSSDQRVRIGESQYVYPDVVALCAPPRYTEDRPASLLNPEFIVEVTSESTARRDWLQKLDAYLQVESLREYWIVEPTVPRLAQCIRHHEEWVVRLHRGLGAEVGCEVFDLTMQLAAIYTLVDLQDGFSNSEDAESDGGAEPEPDKNRSEGPENGASGDAGGG